MTFTLKIEVEVKDEDIQGLLCSGFEGGIGYWAEVVAEKFPKGTRYADFKEGGKFQDPKEYWHPYEIIPLHEGCALIIKSKVGEDEERFNKKFRLDREALERGLKVMSEKYPRHWADFRKVNYDAITGDVYIQCCLFGEIVYG